MISLATADLSQSDSLSKTKKKIGFVVRRTLFLDELLNFNIKRIHLRLISNVRFFIIIYSILVR